MGNNSSDTPNFHIFANIENSNRSLQQPLMDVINIISTCVNFILFYLILFDPRRRESRTYRMILFVQTFSLWLSQLHWGSLHGLVFLFPFPGLYGIGYLTPYLSSYVLVIIWLFMFAVTVLTMFLILIVRLKAIARQNSFFNFPSFIYVGFTILLTFYILIPMPFCWITSGSTTSESQNFVNEFYPNASKVLTIPGVFIYTDSWKFHRILLVAIGLLVTGGVLYVVLCQVILYEIHQQCKIWSEKVLKYHRKALKDSVIQVLILGIFLGATPFLQILNAYRDPEVDTIIVEKIYLNVREPDSFRIFHLLEYCRNIIRHYHHQRHLRLLPNTLCFDYTLPKLCLPKIRCFYVPIPRQTKDSKSGINYSSLNGKPQE